MGMYVHTIRECNEKCPRTNKYTIYYIQQLTNFHSQKRFFYNHFSKYAYVYSFPCTHG